MAKHKEGKKGRKIGRASRKPAHKRYNAEHRWEKNKIRRAKKHVKNHSPKRNNDNGHPTG